MKQKKEPIVKDERTMLIDGKIAGELVLGMTCFIAVSALPSVRPWIRRWINCSGSNSFNIERGNI